jgi:hypothetical protein
MKLLDVFVPPSKTLGHWEHEQAIGGVFVQSGVYAVMKKRSRDEYEAAMNDPALTGEYEKVVSDALERGQVLDEATKLQRAREKIDKGVKIASRGFSPQNIGVSDEVSWTQAMVKVLFEDIPACWKEGKPAYVFERQQYMTIGASLARNPPPPVTAKRPWKRLLIGWWIKSQGKLQLDAMSRKRTIPADRELRSSRSEGQVALTVNHWPLGGDVESFPSRPKWMDPQWFRPEWRGVREEQEEGVERDFEGESEIEALDEQGDVIAGLSAG